MRGGYSGAPDGQASPATAAAVQACPDQNPMLRIETGTHVATIKRISVDAECRLMATASEDKTVRLWAIPEGRLLQTIRFPIDDVNGGKLNAVALSSNGRMLAAGGWDAGWEKGKAMGVYVADLATGQVQRLGGFRSVTNHLAFSPDGARLAVALNEQQGVHVLDPATGRELMPDRQGPDSPYGLVFGPDGSLFTTSYDAVLRRYGPDLRLSAQTRAPGGQRPLAIAVDPSGRRTAVGYVDSDNVSILRRPHDEADRAG